MRELQRPKVIPVPHGPDSQDARHPCPDQEVLPPRPQHVRGQEEQHEPHERLVENADDDAGQARGDRGCTRDAAPGFRHEDEKDDGDAQRGDWPVAQERGRRRHIGRQHGPHKSAQQACGLPVQDPADTVGTHDSKERPPKRPCQRRDVTHAEHRVHDRHRTVQSNTHGGPASQRGACADTVYQIACEVDV